MDECMSTRWKERDISVIELDQHWDTLDTGTMQTLWILMFMINESESQSETESSELALVNDMIKQETMMIKDRVSPLRFMNPTMSQKHRNAITVKKLNILQGIARGQRRGLRSKLLQQYHMIHSAELHAMMICAECTKAIRTVLDGTHNKTSRRRTVKSMTQQIYLWKSWTL